MRDKNSLYRQYRSTHAGQFPGADSGGGSSARVWRVHFGALLPNDRTIPVLDLGCGDGTFVRWLRKEGFARIEGIDVSEEQVARARELGVEGVARADLFAFLPSRPSAYGLMVARDVLEHFAPERTLDILRAARAALRPGGVFIAQSVNAENPLWGRLRHGDFTHETAFTASSIRQALSLAGFRRIEVFPQRPVVHGLFSLVRAALWRLIEWKLRIYLLVETGSARGIFTQNLIVRAET